MPTKPLVSLSISITACYSWMIYFSCLHIASDMMTPLLLFLPSKFLCLVQRITQVILRWTNIILYGQFNAQHSSKLTFPPGSTISPIVKTSSSWLGPDKEGKCESVGLSAACPSKVAMIHSMVVAVAWAKANQVWDRLQVLSCIPSAWVNRGQSRTQGFRIRKGQRRDRGQRYGKYLSWLSDWGTRDRV